MPEKVEEEDTLIWQPVIDDDADDDPDDDNDNGVRPSTARAWAPEKVEEEDTLIWQPRIYDENDDDDVYEYDGDKGYDDNIW